MTPDDLVRALTYRRDELVLLSDLIGKELNAFLGKNVRLDQPDVAFLLGIRGCIDQSIGLLAQALVAAREPAAFYRGMVAEDAERPPRPDTPAEGLDERADDEV